MCEICDGRTEQELFERMRARIDDHQFTLQGVESGPHTVGWVYTIGLVDAYDHPELVITGGEMQRDGGALAEIALQISQGLRVDVGDALDLAAYRVQFGAVHESYLDDGLLACWTDYYARIGYVSGPLRALEVLAPRCGPCGREQHRLAIPGSTDFGRRPNRAARRARQRAHRR